MQSTRIFFSLLSLATSISASPLDVQRLEARQQWNPFSPCSSCFRSSWTQGAECKTDANLLKTISRVLNPPASETSTYTPTKWCTDYLHQTDWSTTYTTASLTSTYTNWTITHLFVTKTDLDHPTSTRLCPSSSSGMECGYDSNTIAPIEQGEDWSIEHAIPPTECQQVCLEHSACKAYRVDGSDQKGWNCEIFNVGLGKNASNVINATPKGTQWWDRNCQQHVFDACKTAPALPNAAPFIPTPAVALQPIITPAPPAPPYAALAKRDAPLPPYMSDLSYFWSGVYLTPACSCIITSALPATLKTSTQVVTKWIASVTVYSTYEDWFTVTTTPRSTTIYTTVG